MTGMSTRVYRHPNPADPTLLVAYHGDHRGDRRPVGEPELLYLAAGATRLAPARPGADGYPPLGQWVELVASPAAPGGVPRPHPR